MDRKVPTSPLLLVLTVVALSLAVPSTGDMRAVLSGGEGAALHGIDVAVRRLAMVAPLSSLARLEDAVAPELGWTWSSTGASSPATSGRGRSGPTGRRASSRARRAGVRTPAEAAKRCTGATTINGGQLDGHTIITCNGSNFIGVFHLNLIRIDYFNPLKPFPLCSH